MIVRQPALLAYSLEGRIRPRIEELAGLGMGLRFVAPHLIGLSPSKYREWVDRQSADWTILSHTPDVAGDDLDAAGVHRAWTRKADDEGHKAAAQELAKQRTVEAEAKDGTTKKPRAAPARRKAAKAKAEGTKPPILG